MSLDELMDELEPADFEAIDTSAESDTQDPIYESLTQMLKLAERTAKSGYRAGQSTEFVGQKVSEIKDFMEEEVEAREQDLRRARSEIGELTEVRDRLVRALMECADLVRSAADAARREVDEDVEGRFDRLYDHVSKILHRAGLEPVAEKGDPFDPEFHEAADRVADSSAESRTIIEVLRQGYRFGGQTVRIARVVVAE